MSQPTPDPTPVLIKDGAVPKRMVDEKHVCQGCGSVSFIWKTLQKALLFLVRVSFLFLIIELLKVARAAARWTKRTEFDRTISVNPKESEMMSYWKLKE